MQQARRDIDAVYSMGLFDDVKILPQPAEDSTLGNPVLDLTLQVKERKNGGLSAGCGISAQVTSTPSNQNLVFTGYTNCSQEFYPL